MAQSTYNYNNQYSISKPQKAKKSSPSAPIASSNEQKLLEHLEHSGYTQLLKNSLIKAHIASKNMRKG